jgi:hypothetical protein
MQEYVIGSTGWIMDHCTTGSIQAMRDVGNSSQYMIFVMLIIVVGLYFLFVWQLLKCDKMKKFLKENKQYEKFVLYN